VTYTGERKNQAVIYGKKGILVKEKVHSVYIIIFFMCVTCLLLRIAVLYSAGK